MATNFLTAGALTHSQKVIRLYKKSARLVNGLCPQDPIRQRWNAVLLRDRFEKNKNLAMPEAIAALEDGETEFFKKKDPNFFQFPLSPGGVAYGRVLPFPDFLLDMWHPYEKAQYPHYFAVRDIRKREYIERYEKMVKESGVHVDDHHH